MRQFWKFVICITILTLCVVAYAEETETSAKELTTTTTTIAPNTANITVEISAEAENGTTPEPLPTLAAKLVRQRRQHPYTIIRHVVRQAKRGSKTRRRYKYPKYKYGPPNYNTGAPISFYKPTKQYLPALPDAPKYSPIDETLDLTNFNAANNYDFLPTSSHATNGGGGSYEDQTMDLDFYSNGSGGKTSYKQVPKLSQLEYSKQELPTYSYTKTKTAVSSKPLRGYGKSKKHGASYASSSDGGGDTDYAGDDSYNSSPPGNTYDMHPMGSYDAPSSSQANKYYDFSAVDSGSAHPNVHIPAAKYGVPDVSIPLRYTPPKQSGYHPQAPPSSPDSYVVYEQKIPNSGYNFAEPPPPPKTKVEITYSPSYEITLPPGNKKPANVDSYQPASVENYEPGTVENYQPAPAENYHPPQDYHPTPGNFAEPPPPPSTAYKSPKTSAQPPPPPKYHPPAPTSYKHTPALPPAPTYHAPDTHPPPIYYQESEPELQAPNSYDNVDVQESYESYETPDSHAPPPSFHQPESHAPPSYDQPAPPSFQVPHPPIQAPSEEFEVPVEHAPPSYSAPSAAEQSPEPNYSITSPQSEYPQPDYITPSKDLPINANYMPPAYNYPKSSYEVPIYDPIPFEASSAEGHETFPPHNFVSQHIDSGGHTPAESSPIPTSNAPASHGSTNQAEVHTASAAAPTVTTKAQRPSKKHKRLRNSTPAITTKHVLDTPELEEAYEANQKRKNNQLALSNDADANESNKVEAKPSNKPNYFLPTIAPDTAHDQNYISPAWNPVRIRTPTALPAAAGVGKAQTPSSASTASIARSKGRRQPVVRTTTNRQQTSTNFTPAHRTRQTTPLHSEGGEQKVDGVTVVKSHSYSYYDGTSTSPKAKEVNVQRVRASQKRQQQQEQQKEQRQQQQQQEQHQSHHQHQLTRTPYATIRQRTPTREQTAPPPQRTTKSVFETTYFKSPHNDHRERHLEDYVQSLPKNHKWF